MVNLLNDKDAKHDLRRDYGTREPVLKTWQITINKIREASPKSADMLALMRMFDRQEIPRVLFDGGMTPLQLEDTIDPLLSYSLVQMQTQKDDFTMHRLVQVAAGAWLRAENEFSRWKSEALRVMAKVIPTDPIDKNWPLCQALLPHTKEFFSSNLADPIAGDVLNVATVLQASGWYLMEKNGEYKGAEKNMRDSVTMCEQVLGSSHEMTIESLGALSSALRVQGEYSEAELVVRRALKLSEDTHGTNAMTTTKPYLNWAYYCPGRRNMNKRNRC